MAEVTRHAHKIRYTMVFVPGEDWDGIPYEESVRWLEQYYPCTQRCVLTNRRILLLEGTETYPTKVWSMKSDHYRGLAHLEWERPEEVCDDDSLCG